MKRLITCAPALAFAGAVLAAVPAAAQDFVVTYKSEDGITKTYVSQAAVRESSPEEDTIYLIERGKIIVVNHEKKTYHETTLEEWRQSLGALTADPKLVEAARRRGLQATPSVSKVGPGETIAGYATEKYLVKTALGQTEIWAAPALQVPKAFWDLLSPGGSAQPGVSMAQFFEEMRKIGGVPLKSVSKLTMGVTLEDVATSVQKGPIAASAFELPAGYKAAPR